MLTTLRRAGWLARVRGVVRGAFTDASPGPDGTEIDAVLADRLGDLGVPVLAGLPAGHVETTSSCRSARRCVSTPTRGRSRSSRPPWRAEELYARMGGL